jgi:hypothetical protein
MMLLAAVLACSPITTPQVTSSPVVSAAVTPQPSATGIGPSRSPADLTRLPEEQPVIDALMSAGMRVDLIGGSKWESQLGTKRPARVFIGDLHGRRVGADVIFLDAPVGEIRYCKLPDPHPGFMAWNLSFNGRESRGEGSVPTTILYGQRHFVITYDDPRIVDALRNALGLSVPPCLPLPSEERAVVGALTNAGVGLSLVGLSKFDWILGDAARRSGIFTGTIDGTQVRADVLFLDFPANNVTVCTEERPGETKFTVRVDGRVHSASPVTGSAMGPLYFAMNERFFVMSTNVRVRDALRDALGLSEPRC